VLAASILGAKLQSAAWLYNFWKIGLPLAAIAYALVKNATVKSERSLRGVILGSIVITTAVVCGLTLIATADEGFLPRLMIGGTSQPFVSRLSDGENPTSPMSSGSR
jgi:hypothetical protein